MISTIYKHNLVFLACSVYDDLDFAVGCVCVHLHVWNIGILWLNT